MPQLRSRSARNSSVNLSIIVPWMGDDQLFEDTLASVLRNQPEGSEIIVSHDQRFVDQHDLGGEVHFCQVPESSAKSSESCLSLRTLFNHAMNRSKGEIINLVRPGVEVDEGWGDLPIEILNGNSQIATVSTPILNANRPKRLLTCGINHTSRLKRVLVDGQAKSSWQQLNRRVIGPSSWCAFYSRNALRQSFDGQVGIEDFSDSSFDLEIALTLNSVGYKHQVAADFSVSSELDLETEEIQSNGLDAARMAVRYEGFLAETNQVARAAAAVAEYATGLISPSRAKFTLGRFGARKYLNADKQHARDLKSLRQMFLERTGSDSDHREFNRAA